MLGGGPVMIDAGDSLPGVRGGFGDVADGVAVYAALEADFGRR